MARKKAKNASPNPEEIEEGKTKKAKHNDLKPEKTAQAKDEKGKYNEPEVTEEGKAEKGKYNEHMETEEEKTKKAKHNDLKSQEAEEGKTTKREDLIPRTTLAISDSLRVLAQVPSSWSRHQDVQPPGLDPESSLRNPASLQLVSLPAEKSASASDNNSIGGLEYTAMQQTNATGARILLPLMDPGWLSTDEQAHL